MSVFFFFFGRAQKGGCGERKKILGGIALYFETSFQFKIEIVTTLMANKKNICFVIRVNWTFKGDEP